MLEQLERIKMFAMEQLQLMHSLQQQALQEGLKEVTHINGKRVLIKLHGQILPVLQMPHSLHLFQVVSLKPFIIVER